MLQEVGASGVLAFVFIELGAGDPESESLLAEGAEEDGRLTGSMQQPLA